MTRLAFLTAAAALLASALPAPAGAQVAPEGLASVRSWSAEEAPAPTVRDAPRPVRTHPLVRSPVIVLGSAAGFAIAQARQAPGEMDQLEIPIAAGVAGGAIAGWIFSEAHPAKVLAGAVLGTLPAGALAYFLAGHLDEDTQGQIPLVAFSVPHGLVTSAFAQSPRR
jgi:hypothetical protein